MVRLGSRLIGRFRRDQLPSAAAGQRDRTVTQQLQRLDHEAQQPCVGLGLARVDRGDKTDQRAIRRGLG